MERDKSSSQSGIGSRTKNGGHISPSEEVGSDIQIQDIVTSESKTPLKTPMKEGDENSLRFSANDSTINEVNGDAKIDMDDVRSCFSGMSKEELLKYANDPFWVRIRMVLFIFFWIVWIIMFVGAISIIIVAPKCEPPKWYNQGPLYDVDIPQFLHALPNAASGLLKTFSSKLPYLNDLNVKAIILSPIFKTNGNIDVEDVIDFKDVDPIYGTLADFKNLIKEAGERAINVILTFVPNHSSDVHSWFNKSIAREEPYDKYYIWAQSSGTGPDGSELPPNNWLSVTGGSAWEWNDERQEFYLHQFGVHQPDLNFRSPELLKEINDTLNFWLDLGVSGFNLDKVQYLLEDESLQDEEVSRSKPGVVHTDYDFYYHSKTHNLPENAAILSKLRNTVHGKTDGNGILIINGDAPIPSDSNETTISVDIMRNDKLLSHLPQNFTSSDLYPRLEKLVKSSTNDWPLLQLGDKNNRLGDRFGQDVDGLNIITLLIKGTPIIYFGEELGLHNKSYFPWTNDSDSLLQQEEAKESHFKIFKALMKARESKAVIYGSSNITVMNDSVLVLTRIKPGSPGYLSAYNLSPLNVTVDFSSIENVPEELMVFIISLNYAAGDLKIKDKVASEHFLMSPRSAVVFTFVPNIDENS